MYATENVSAVMISVNHGRGLKIGVSEETALEDACKIEHDLSEETFEAIKKFVNSK